MIAVGTYLAARSFGTWELYLLAFALLGIVLVSWLLVQLTTPRLTAAREARPERPVAGAPFLLSCRVRNGSSLPGLQIDLPDAAGDLAPASDGGTLEFDALPSHGFRAVTLGPMPARRGVHRLPPLRAVARDPLGLVRAERLLGEPMRITVYPDLAELSSCLLFADLGTRRGGRRGNLPTIGGSEFRSIRPHMAGEPLSRVDWKSTAKTGSLMLREMDDPTSGDMAVLLEQAAALDVGEAPDSSFELAVRAAGSVADFGLRAGRGVRLLSPDGGRGWARLAPDTDGRRRLLEILAEVRPRAGLPLSASLRGLLADGRPLAQTRSLTLVVLRLDRELVRVLVALQGNGRRVSVVHVDGASFSPSPNGGRPPGAAKAAPRPAAASDEPRRLQIALTAAGIPCLALRRGDDLRAALSVRSDRAAQAGPARAMVP